MNSLVLIWVLACSLIDLHLLIQLVNHVSFFFPQFSSSFTLLIRSVPIVLNIPANDVFACFPFFPFSRYFLV